MCWSLKFTLKFPNFSSRAWYGSSRTRVHTCAHVYQARQPITGTLCTVLHNGTCVHVYTTVLHTLYTIHCTLNTVHIKLYAAQISKDWGHLQSMSYFKIFSTLISPEWLLCRGQPAVTGHKSPMESKNAVHISWPHLDDQVEAFQVEDIPGILNFEVTLRPIHTYSTFKTCFSLFLIVSFRNTP